MAAAEPLKVDTTELRLTAGKLEGHGAEFAESHQAAHSRAGGALLGSGEAAGALPGMLAEWEKAGAEFEAHFTRFADGHRGAADGYDVTDSAGEEEIGRASAGL